jgi:hypothetical protein
LLRCVLSKAAERDCRLLNTCTYGQLFQDASDAEMDSLRTLGHRWKQYEKEGKWKYEAHPFWCTGYTFVS